MHRQSNPKPHNEHTLHTHTHARTHAHTHTHPHTQLAMKWHPDKNTDNSDEAAKQFQAIGTLMDSSTRPGVAGAGAGVGPASTLTAFE